MSAQIRANEILSRLDTSQRLVGVEVGVATGQTSEALLNTCPKLILYMVDSWLGTEDQPKRYVDSWDGHSRFTKAEQEAHYEHAVRAVKFAGDRAAIIRMPSVEAAQNFGDKSLDFVFIDADHSYEGCLEDINAWSYKIKHGGLLCGHDYYSEPPPGHKDSGWALGPKKAVDEAVTANGWKLRLGGNATWFVRM